MIPQTTFGNFILIAGTRGAVACAGDTVLPVVQAIWTVPCLLNQGLQAGGASGGEGPQAERRSLNPLARFLCGPPWGQQAEPLFQG